ncbi:DUF624 domain-containing protein [Virgibacillus halodenitrificans]|nr:DUF624 domain-containing protein [Virgibacillus halodenitrificans]
MFIMETTFSEKLYIGSEWLVRLAYLQVLFFAFMIAGAGVFGLFPSLAAMMAISRQWLKGNHTSPLHKSFYTYFKQYFLVSNVLGLLLSFASVGIILYIYWFMQLGGIWANIYIYVLYLLLFITVLVWIYWLPVLVHFDIKAKQIFKYAILVGMMRPHYTLFLMLLIISLYLLSLLVPGIIPILSISLIVVGWNLIIQRAFQKISEKQGQKKQV